MSLQQPFLKEPFTTLFHTFLRFSNFSGYNFFECFQRIIYCRKQFESKFRTVPHLFVFALSFQEQVSPWQSKMHLMLFSHGTCWGFRSPIPRITLRLSPRFLPAALRVLISQSKEKCLSAPKNKQTGQPKPTRIEAHSLEARMIDNTTSFAAFRL